MSSEDDYYYDRYDYRYDRRSSKRPRRRASSPRRHRNLESDYFRRKNRRTKAVYNQFAPRIAGFIILLTLTVYEVLVFKGAASSKLFQSPRTRKVSQPSSPPVVEHNNPASLPKLPSPTPRAAPSKSTTNTSLSPTLTVHSSSPAISRVKQKPVSVTTAVARSPSPASANVTKDTISSSKPSEVKTNSKQVPESAIIMESEGADQDPDVEQGIGSNRRSSDSANDSSSPGDQLSTSKSRDIGAEPGAGENFWNWFQETKGSDNKSTSKSLPCPEEYKRLCMMFYKYIRKYKIRRIFDVSCDKNSDWIVGILKKAGNELWGFKYYCSLWNGPGNTHKRLEGLPFIEFDDGKWWKTGFAHDTELLFAWDTLPHLAYGRVWNFFVKARKQDVKYILVDNYPGILNDPSPKRDYLNLRKHPFRFPSAKEVAQNVTEPGETANRQLLFYETSMLPDNLQ